MLVNINIKKKHNKNKTTKVSHKDIFLDQQAIPRITTLYWFSFGKFYLS
jgi:hypothetical protein